MTTCPQGPPFNFAPIGARRTPLTALSGSHHKPPPLLVVFNLLSRCFCGFGLPSRCCRKVSSL